MLPGRYRPIYRLSLFLSDFAGVNAAFYLSYFIWLVLHKGVSPAPGPMYIQLWLFVNALWLPLFYLSGMYSESLPADFSVQFRKVFSGVLSGIVLLTFAIFFIRFIPNPEIYYSRAVIFILWALSFIMLIFGRGVIHLGILYLKKRDRLRAATLLMGAPDEVERVFAAMKESRARDFNVLGAVLTSNSPLPGSVPLLGEAGDLDRIVRENNVEVVILADPGLPPSETLKIIASCREIGVAFHILQNYIGVMKTSTIITDIAGLPTLAIRDTPIRGFNKALKRAIDVTFAFSILLALSPMLILTALLILLDTPGPVFFRQSRVGRNGKHFSILKFRSMRREAEAEKAELEEIGKNGDHLFKIHSDPRITRVGRFIRKWSIDELPQLFNVLFGEMSMVGPRPLIPREAAGYEEWHARRLEITPGITGLWQVSGRNELNFNDMVKLDIYYIENWSLWLDFEILLRTFPAVLTRRGAY